MARLSPALYMKGKLLVVSAASVVTLTSYLLAHDQLDFQGTFPAPSVSTNGSGSVEFASNGITLLSWLTIPDLDSNASEGNDCWGYTSPSGRDYGIIGTNTSTCFVDLTDPGSPVLLNTIAGPTSSWRDIKTYQTYAYAVSEGGGGIQVFDLSSIDSGTVTLTNTVTTGGCTQASHNVAIDETSGFLYRAGGSGSPCGGGPQGLIIYSLANPAAPAYVGEWNDKYVHDVQVVTWDIPGPHFGKQLAFACANNSSGGGTPSLYIVDVTNKNSPSVLGSTTYGSSAFSHQGWLSSDKQYFYLNDELDESNFGTNTTTRILDVSNPANPFQTGTFSSGTSSIDHNLYVDGDLIYEANYRSGLRVFDASNPTNPVQTAFFDTYESDDAAAFNSLWSCYPYFDDQKVIGSDLEKGLFVWWAGDPELTFNYPNGQPELVSPDGGTTMEIQVQEETPGDLASGTIDFHVDTGGGFQTTTLSPVGGPLSFVATFPAAPCGNAVRWYVSASSDDNITWSDPTSGGTTQVNMATAGLFTATVLEDDLETNTGWSVNLQGNDTASTGIWTRVNPIGTAAQPEDDHTPSGVRAWVTGQGSSGGSLGENDIDGGFTTLTSPVLDASGLSDPFISYWRWYVNNGNGTVDDIFEVDISNNGGSSWTNLETLGPVGAGTSGGWIQYSARISDTFAPTSQMRLRFRASDLGGGSIVEAAIDDLAITDTLCALSVASVNPGSGGTRGGNTVTVTGVGFLPGQTTVEFGGIASSNVTVLNTTTLRAEVPPAPRSGKRGLVNRAVDVTVTTGPGSATLAGGYTYGETLRTP